jgi:hypothetical protein
MARQLIEEAPHNGTRPDALMSASQTRRHEPDNVFHPHNAERPSMKSLVAVLLCLSTIATVSRSQDLSSFYTITGFRLPALKSGQFALVLTPHYMLKPSDYASLTTSSSTTASPTASSTTNTDNWTSYYTPYKAFNAVTNFTYGLTDQTTFSLGVNYQPYASYGIRPTQGFSSTEVLPTGSLTQTATNGPTNFSTESIASTFILAHRFLPNVEFSVAASWSYARSPYTDSSIGTGLKNSGGTNPILSSISSTSSQQISNNSHSLDISASLVILGN